MTDHLEPILLGSVTVQVQAEDTNAGTISVPIYAGMPTLALTKAQAAHDEMCDELAGALGELDRGHSWDWLLAAVQRMRKRDPLRGNELCRHGIPVNLVDCEDCNGLGGAS
ncbi:MAG: hypothetical protein ACRDQG_12150 [Pseudonocardiaceae bacterium]